MPPQPTRARAGREPGAAGSAVAPVIRVVIADDHPFMRRTMRLLLDAEAAVTVIAEAGDLPTAVRLVHDEKPDVLVLDLRMPSGLSIDAIRRLREEVPATKIVVVTMEQNPVFARHALAAGAIGFVLKDWADTDLPAAVLRAARGEKYVSPSVAAQLAPRRRADRRGVSAGG